MSQLVVMVVLLSLFLGVTWFVFYGEHGLNAAVLSGQEAVADVLRRHDYVSDE